jgi:hypothetical protein
MGGRGAHSAVITVTFDGTLGSEAIGRQNRTYGFSNKQNAFRVGNLIQAENISLWIYVLVCTVYCIWRILLDCGMVYVTPPFSQS